MWPASYLNETIANPRHLPRHRAEYFVVVDKLRVPDCQLGAIEVAKGAGIRPIAGIDKAKHVYRRLAPNHPPILWSPGIAAERVFGIGGLNF